MAREDIIKEKKVITTLKNSFLRLQILSNKCLCCAKSPKYKMPLKEHKFGIYRISFASSPLGGYVFPARAVNIRCQFFASASSPFERYVSTARAVNLQN